MGGRISRLTPDIIDASSLPNAFPEVSRSQRAKVQSTSLHDANVHSSCACTLQMILSEADACKRDLGGFPQPCRSAHSPALAVMAAVTP